MRCNFNDRDLQSRLDNTICQYKGHPVYVRYYDTGKLSISKITGKGDGSSIIRGDDPLLDISSPPLGFVQLDKRVAYLSRLPQRRWKQGLDNDNVRWEYLTKGEEYYKGGNLLSKNVERTILGEFIPLEEVLNKINETEEPLEYAISRDVALKYDPDLQIIVVYFKGVTAEHKAGWMIRGSNTVIVPSREQAWIISMYLAGHGWKVQ